MAQAERHYLSYTEEDPMPLVCGGEAIFDVDSGIGFRCIHCGAMVGSIGMPTSCKEAFEAEEMWKTLSNAKTR